MKKKLLYINIMCFVIALAFVIGGVFAASQLKYSISGAIKFESNDCWVNIEGQVDGSANEVADYQYFAKGQGSAKTWETGDIDFDRSQNNTITIPLTFENYSYYKVKATISGLPASNENFETDISSTTLYMLEYSDGGVADAETATITLTLKDGVESATFPLSLSVLFEKIDTIDASPYFTYTTSGTSATITGLTELGATRTAIEIPKQINDLPVVTIDDGAFESNYNIKRVKIPDSVTNIGISAFEDCTNLEQINIPSALKTLSSKAFKGCTKIKEISIANSVTDIGPSAFESCIGLEVIHMPIGLTEIKEHTFYSCTNLRTINYPVTLTSIGECAFAYCATLKNVTIPTGVTTIGNKAFKSCLSISEINYQATVCSDFSALSEVFSGAGEALGGIVFNVADNVTAIPAYAFSGNVISGVVEGGSVKEIKFGTNSQCLTIGDYAFSNNKKITNMVYPDSLLTIGDYAFYQCANIQSFDFPNGLETIGAYVFANVTKPTILNLPDSVKTVGDSAFRECLNLKEVILSDSLETIGASAFYKLPLVESLTIPANVISIGNHAFREWSNLVEIRYNATLCADSSNSNRIFSSSGCNTEGINMIIGENVKRIPSYMFHPWYSDAETFNLKNVYVDGENPALESIGNRAFAYLPNLTSVTIPVNTTMVEDQAFLFNYYLREINYEAVNCVMEYGSYGNPFEYCGQKGPGIKITIGEKVEVIPDYLFNTTTLSAYNQEVQYAAKVTEVDIKSNVLTTIGAAAFANGKFNTIRLPSSVTSIASNAFSYCQRLVEVFNESTSVTVGASVATDVYNGEEAKTATSKVFKDENGYVFHEYETGKYKLISYVGESTDIVIPQTYNGVAIEEIRSCSFRQEFYTVKSVVIPDNIKIIGASAFANCKSMKTLTIGKGVESFGGYAFRECTAITTMNYNAISCADLSTKNYVFEELATAKMTFTIGNEVEKIPANLFYTYSNKPKFTGEITIPSSVKYIGSNAFNGCSTITSVIFEQTSGWWYASSSTATTGTAIASESLIDSATAATYLKSTYLAYYWNRT